MNKQTMWLTLAAVFGVAYLLSYTGLYGTGRAVGYINMGLVVLVFVCVLMMKRSAPPPR